MKGKTYYTVRAGEEVFSPSLQSPSHSRPWVSDTTSPVPSTQIYYMWSSSIPHNWKLISSRPVRRIKGEVNDKRNTLDFLRETQKYINTIRKPIRNEMERSLSPRTVHECEILRLESDHLSKPRTSSKPQRTSPNAEMRRVQSSKSPRLTIPVTVVREPSTTAPRKVLSRNGSMPSMHSASNSQIESLIRDQSVSGFVRDRMKTLVPVSRKKAKTSQAASRKIQTRPQVYMQRFRRPNDTLAAGHSTKGFIGSKLSGNPTLHRHKRTMSSISPPGRIPLSPEMSLTSNHY